MGHSHRHFTDGNHDIWINRAAERSAMRIVTAIVIPVIGVLAYVVATTWPQNYSATLPLLGNQAGANFIPAVVTTIDEFECVSTTDPNAVPVAGGNRCANVTAALSQADSLGTTVTFEADPALMRQELVVGTHVVLASIQTEGNTTYVFQDFDRGRSIPLALAILFLVVAVVGRWQGVRALGGLVVGLVMVAGYAAPLLAGGAGMIPIVTVTLPLVTLVLLYGAHGYNLKTTAAIIGTLTATGIAVVGAVLAIKGMTLTGLSSEDGQLLVDNIATIDLRDVLAVSLVISGFGALNDVTVTQASAVWELSATKGPSSGERAFTGAMRIGRDHIASAIYTVAFAYAGSSLITLMLIMLSGMPTNVLANSELVANEVAFLTVGLAALVLSMPITTWVASLLANRVRRQS